MSQEEKKGKPIGARGPLDKFELGGELGPVEDRNEYEKRINSLPPDQRELAQENTRLADLCHYFSEQKIDVPPPVLDQVGRLSQLAMSDRIRALKSINRELMEYLNDADKGPGIRQ